MLRFKLAAAIALLLAAPPLAAQGFSDGYNFLKAVKERDGDKVTDLIASDPTVINRRDAGSGEGALHIVTRNRDLTWLSFLLGKGARPDIQSKEGMTALAIAAQIGWAEGAQLLLARRASVDLPNRSGETPLILAVQRRDVVLTRMLLAKGANPKKSDSAAGLSAIDYAKRDSRAAAILKLLEENSAPKREVSGPGL